MNSAEASLSFVEILKYLDADNASRCIMEGERIINANHLITCGVTESSATGVKLFALCLRTSSLTSKPHAITGSFKLENENFKIEKFVCTCTAGEGEACKHITATLIFCNRNSITKLQKLSSTDVQCIWTQKKKDVLLPYNPVPLQDACCSKKPDWLVEKEPVGTETMLYYRSELLAACPDSALAKHQKRVSEASKECSNVFQSESERIDGLEGSWKNIFHENLFICKLPNFLNLSDEVFYERYVSLTTEGAILLAERTSSQDNDLWHEERKKRITGSTCYPLFTYRRNKNADWEKKIDAVSCSYTNSNMSYGLDMEGIATATFCTQQNFTVKKVGIIVHPDMPWLGYSPDGLLYKNGDMFLLEIKCPVSGQSQTAVEVIQSLPYITVKNGQYILKEKHKYFGQVQLGMFLTHTSICKFVVYSSYDSTFVVVDVPISKKFLKSFIDGLHSIYFNYYLPKLSKIYK